MNNNTKYTNVAIALHWLIGIAILFMFILGWFMTELPKESAKTTSFDIFNLGLMTWEVAKEESPRAFYFNLHKSIGLTILMLIVLRMYWRFTHRPPAFLNSMKLWEKRLAKATHHSLYLLMFLIPLSGIIMSAGSKYGIKWFGFKVIPGFDDKAIRELFFEFHEIFGLLLLLLLIFHILGAIKHSIIDKDGTLRRMWFSK
jgi:cytochrome b561